MNELTKKYYKGKLKMGCYYFSNGMSVFPLEHHELKGLKPSDEDNLEVVGKVPDYHALQHLKRKLIQAKPELEAWVIKHYGELER